MADDPKDDRDPRREFAEQVDRKAGRRLDARRRPDRAAWFWLGMFGLVGWSVAVPTLIGVALGLWIDRSWESDVSWTLTLLFVGVVLGCWNAWRWVRRESERRD